MRICLSRCARFPLAADNADELLFAHNNSSIRVATSMRSGTIHRLHVSEFGKICAKYPDKAKEVVTGSIPAVPTNGVLVIESTAEGREGEFFRWWSRRRSYWPASSPSPQGLSVPFLRLVAGAQVPPGQPHGTSQSGGA